MYTVGAGDEPGAIKELYDFASGLGFKVIAAGKGKNNPLDRQATPDSVRELARKKGIGPRILAEFIDGSKTMMEMTTVANATGLVPDVRGMHGPSSSLDELTRVFAHQSKGGILAREGVVDYALGNVAPGVFVVFTTEDTGLARDLDYIGMGAGPGYLLYRPYHLVSMEIPVSIARAAIYGEPTIASQGQPVAETVAVAKRNLKAGTRLGAIGGTDAYGLIETAANARTEGLLPLGLAEGAVVVSDVKENTPLRWDQVEIEQSDVLLNLRLLQDSMHV